LDNFEQQTGREIKIKKNKMRAESLPPSGRLALTATTVAVLATFTACLGGLLAIVGEVAAAVVTTFPSGFGGFLTVIGEVARIGFTSSHMLFLGQWWLSTFNSPHHI
jgi:hypothetical protein